MSKVFRYELHQAPKVNHESFRFVENLNSVEKELKVIEKYLSDIENNLDITQEAQLRRKIANIFEPQLAYKIFTAIELNHQSSSTDSLEEDTIMVRLPNNFILTKKQQKTLEETIISVYGYVTIQYEKISLPQEKIKKTVVKDFKKTNLFQQEKNYQKIVAPVDDNSVWGKVRQSLKQEYGETIDKIWFSQIIAEEDRTRSSLNLYVPSCFIRDWVKNNYCPQIRHYRRLFENSERAIK